MMGNILELKNITKKYPGVNALNNVNLTIEEGEVHALCGENGAGKSTLIKTISGAIAPTAGTIILNGKAFDHLSPSSARENGVAVVYQEFTLVPVLSVADNIFMGNFICTGGLCNKNAMNKRANELFKNLDVKINPNEKVEDLTTGYQQIVEIAKAVSQDAKVLIMDEPSAPLTTHEVDAMFDVVHKLKKEGVTIIYISHRLEEVFSLADRVTVLRDGEVVGTKRIEDTNKEELIHMMVGRTLSETYPRHDYNIADSETVLSVKNLYGNGVENISFELKKGEILGFGGLVGAGRTELVEMIFGKEKIKSGEMIFKGEKIIPSGPHVAIAKGIALVPEDRKIHGVLLEMSITDNMCIPAFKLLSKFFLVDRKAQELYSLKQVENLKIKTPGLKQKVKNLSGGNQQKVVLGKWLGVEPDILIFDEPTRGIDVGAKQEIYKIMTEIAQQGKSIIMISSEMEELVGMSDRMVILSKGRQTATLTRDEFSQETILKYFAEVV